MHLRRDPNHFFFKLLLFTAVCLVVIQAAAQGGADIDEQTLLRTGVPLVEIQGNDGEWPSCDYITHPEGAMGEGITNVTKVPGRIVIKTMDSTLYDSGPYKEKLSGMTFKIHGNTSAYQEQKSYKVKLQQKADLLSRGDDQRYRDKNWLLINSGPWIQMMIGFRLSQLTGLEWTPALQYVNLIVNGKYCGVYALVEQVKRNEQCRINVDKKTGYIIERDPYWWNEPIYFNTLYKKEYTFKYPDEDDVTEAQVNYIRSSVVRMETAINDGTYENYIDIDSWATWLLTHDILGTWDSGGSNIYLAKNDDTDSSPFRMCCIWDFDSMTRMKDAWARIHTDSFFYFPQLLRSPNPAFLRAYVEKWEKLSPTLFDQMHSYLDSISRSDFGDAVRELKVIEARALKYSGTTLEEDMTGYHQWFSSREVWLKSQFEALKTDVRTIHEQQPVQSEIFYNPAGQRITHGYRGLIIGNDGRKWINLSK